MAIVGESGSGKTSLALAVARLLPPGGEIAAGSVRVDGVDVTGLTGAELRRARGRLVGYLAQDSMAALNPVLPAGPPGRRGVRDARRRAAPRGPPPGGRAPRPGRDPAGGARSPRMYPHELSGGMRQRVMIAMALALRSRLLIADEPTTALDVTVQAEILALAAALQAEHGVTFLWITHDMGVVAEIADTVARHVRRPDRRAGAGGRGVRAPGAPLHAGASRDGARRSRGAAEVAVRDHRRRPAVGLHPAGLPVPPPLRARPRAVRRRRAGDGRRRPRPPRPRATSSEPSR